MSTSKFEPRIQTRDVPFFQDKTIEFREAWHDGREVLRIDPPSIFLNWDQGGIYTIDYPRNHGLLMVPFPGIFTGGRADGRIFELVRGNRNTLTLASKADITRAGFPVDGTFRFSFAIYDFEWDSFAIGHSPPDMFLGP